MRISSRDRACRSNAINLPDLPALFPDRRRGKFDAEQGARGRHGMTIGGAYREAACREFAAGPMHADLVAVHFRPIHMAKARQLADARHLAMLSACTLFSVRSRCRMEEGLHKGEELLRSATKQTSNSGCDIKFPS